MHSNKLHIPLPLVRSLLCSVSALAAVWRSCGGYKSLSLASQWEVNHGESSLSLSDTTVALQPSLCVLPRQVISYQDSNYRRSIPAEERLSICLRFLATGDSYRTIAGSFRAGISTVSMLIPDVVMTARLHCDSTPTSGEERERAGTDGLLSSRAVYQVYAQRPPEDVHEILRAVGAEYVVLENSICHERRHQRGCRLRDLLDLANGHIMDGDGDNDPDLTPAPHPRFCEAVKSDAPAYTALFTRTFQNKTFHVYKLKKKRKKSKTSDPAGAQ
uniref:Transposase n=1 Tax=Knipowitschia caucasica TaxID=637954 RepID=A0AAV2LPW7_KNICA